MNEKLLMQIGLIDQITKPLQGITKDIDHAMTTAKSGMQDMVTGGAGVVATGVAIKTALMPAIEINRKLGEVKSLQVADETLNHLKDTAMDFSMEYGKSATEFIGAAYDIQSAIAGLKGNELSEFTKNSGILAAATKADTATITSYMGTMYGIFEKDAAALGNSNWVERVTGMTAKSVQMFKTDGNKMSQAFTSLGSSASAMGIEMAEQMAVIGQLSATMGGGEAATKYTAFLNGAVKAQQALGLSFFDSQGKMLPMVDILESIQNRIGHLTTDQQFSILSSAFGSSEAVKLIQNLQDKTDSLRTSIVELDKNASVDTAIEMAKAMTDQWNRLDAAFFALRTTVFGAVLPVFEAMARGMADNIGWLVEWLNQYPVLTQWLGYAGIAAVSFGGIVASLSLAMGIAKMMSGGWAVTMAGLSGVLKLLRIGTLAMTATTWLFNAALWANPITWVIAGIVALVAAVGAMIYWWDDLKASFADTTWFRIISAAIDGVIKMLNMIPGVNIEWRASELPTVPAPEVANSKEVTQLQSNQSMPAFAPMFTSVTPEMQALPEANNMVWLDPQYRNTAPELNAKVNPQMQSIPAFAPMSASVTPEMQALPQVSNVVWLDPQYRNNAPELSSTELNAKVNPQMQPMPAFAPMSASVTPEMQALPQVNNVVWLDPQYRNTAPELSSPELNAKVNPQMQPIPAFAAMSVPVTPKMGSLDNTIDTQLIDYKRPERAPQLNKNMVNNMTSSHTKETTNIRQFGDVYINTSASSFDEIEERRELDVG